MSQEAVIRLRHSELSRVAKSRSVIVSASLRNLAKNALRPSAGILKKLP